MNITFGDKKFQKIVNDDRKMVIQNQYFPQSRPHPGKTLAEKLAEMGMGPKEFAVRTGKPEKTISAVLNGKSAITADMAVQFEKVTLIPAHFWMNSQQNFDVFVAREKNRKIIEDAIDWAKLFPYADMAQKGWIQMKTSMDDKASELLAFFGISNHTAWENLYLNQHLKVAYRISLAHTKEPHAISAWLRQGELQAAKLSANDYSEKIFRDTLPEIKKIMATHPDDYYIQLQNSCLRAGVKVVYTPCIKKAPISGCSRWLGDTPLIQLSGRYKRNDIFWFTFFHEVGHILLHGKKEIFLEEVAYTGKEKEKEEEADRFSANYLLTQAEEREIIDAAPLNATKVCAFAKKFHTHPACIIGRLQHKGLIPFSLRTDLIKKIEIAP